MRVCPVSGFIASTVTIVMAIASSLFPAHARADAFPDTVFSNGFQPCANLECLQQKCGAGTTSISGTVYAPNGALPLPNVEVYVPNTAVGSLTTGPQYPRCDETVSGHPLVATLTDVNGHFTLANAPVAAGVPVVVLAGKWRRQTTIDVTACTDNALLPEDTRLPQTHNEGDIPHIAIATGSADSLECLVRKTGVADSEFSNSSGAGRIHLFVATGTAAFDNGGPAFAPATDLWASSTSLSAYDQVMLACEGAQNAGSKPQTSITALKTYVDAGGRAYLAHWQNYWIQTAATPWPSIATWNNGAATPVGPITDTVNSTFPQGSVLASWLFATGASLAPGSIVVGDPRQTASNIDGQLARNWIFHDVAVGPSIQYFTFTTPAESAVRLQRGRVLFADMHPASGDASSPQLTFPGGCTTSTMTPSEKALLYATFDLGRCVGDTRE